MNNQYHNIIYRTLTLIILLFIFAQNLMCRYEYMLSAKKKHNIPIIHSLDITDDNKCKIFWKENIFSTLKQINIYRQNLVSNDTSWTLIGILSKNSNSFFTDFSSNPSLNIYKYKIAYLDSCDEEIFSNNQIQSIKLSVELSKDNSHILKWNKNEALKITKYKIYKGTSPESLICVDSIINNETYYKDVYETLEFTYYQVIAESQIRQNLNNYEKLMYKSNYASDLYDSVINFKSKNYLYVFPNPIRNNSTIYFSNNDFLETFIRFFDLRGNLIMSGITHQNTYYFENKGIKTGVYIIKISNKNFTGQTKVIIGN